MDLLNSILENSSMPWVSALILGLMTAISPCPLATNITAIGYISKDIEKRNLIFIKGLLYTLGRSITYFSIALIIFLGANQFRLSGFFQRNGDRFIGPALIIIGLLMLGIIKINFTRILRLSSSMENKNSWKNVDVLILGIVFALAFCPYSGVLYFGMLIPMTINNALGLYLPVVFAIATGIPVIIFAWLLAYSVSGIGQLYNKIKTFEIWFRYIISVLFIIIGIYYLVKVYF